MFNNLIESTSHSKEFKRRGSFVLLTTVTYGVLLAIAGVASVYAYDAHLDSQSTELEITFMPIIQPEATQPAPPRYTARTPASSERPATHPERTILIDSTANPNNPPDKISTAAQPIPPAPPGAVISNRNVDPDVSIGAHGGVTGGTGNTPAVNIDMPPPPPAPAPPQIPKVLKVSTGVLKSNALSIPKPGYPPLARQIRIQGSISVQVLIDEHGKVVSAKALPGGHQILVNAAETAAMQARFSPTLLSGQPVKVSGVIIYNFVLP
jgi:protein TonB